MTTGHFGADPINFRMEGSHEKIAQSIVRLRKLILTVAVLLLIPSAIGAVATRINYDVLTYLPQELDSMIGEVALEDDFHLASTGMITVEGLPTNELIAMKKDIDAVPGVTQTFWLSDVIDPSIPTEMLPADVQQFMFGKMIPPCSSSGLMRPAPATRR